MFGVSINLLHAASSANWKFDFGSGPVESGYTAVRATTAYDTNVGYGFASTSGLTAINRTSSTNALRSDFITSAAPFKFSANVPSGNYDVLVTVGDNDGTSDTSIKSEVERIIVQQLKTTAGQFAQYSFTVHIKDGVLDLTFYGNAPKVNAIELHQTTSAITMFIAGDSTVCDQNSTSFAGWGQMFSSYLKQGVAVGNYADSGESSWSFWNGFYVKSIQPKIKAGDFLFIQFGHNDEKSGTTTDYKTALKKYIDDARAHGATPILVTPLERNTWSGGVLNHSHGAFPGAMKELAASTNTPVIDLTTMSYNLYASLGQSAAQALFVGTDRTHTNQTGALKIAGFIRDGIRDLKILPLANFLVGSTPPDPLPDGTNYEAEKAVLSGGSVTSSSGAAFSGTGFVNLPVSGGTLTFNNVAGNGGGTKNIGIRYSLGVAGSRTCNLIVNGVTKAITFDPTGSWDKWATLRVGVVLNNTNTNTIQLATTGNDSGDIDYINIPPSTLAADVYQAEDAALAGGALKESTNLGFNGSGYANSAMTGSTITFNDVNPNGGGSKAMTIRYALGAAGSRTGNIIVNGTTIPVTFPSTGTWTTWKTMIVNINLSATGANTIQFATTGNDLANIDEISIPW